MPYVEEPTVTMPAEGGTAPTTPSLRLRQVNEIHIISFILVINGVYDLTCAVRV